MLGMIFNNQKQTLKMKILGFEFRKLETEKTTVECVETWCVRWRSLHHSIGDHWHTNIEVMSFASKETAEMFAKELKDAARLLKNDQQRVTVYKQEHPNNL